MTTTAPPSLWCQIADIDLEFVIVPGGPFLMGTNESDLDAVLAAYPMLKRDWIRKEVPQHARELDSFYIARLPITNALWRAYTDGSGAAKAPSMAEGGEGVRPDHPAWGISFEELTAFCEWVRSEAGVAVRPPSEPEWEKAARGSDGREYPWGAAFDPTRCNTREAGLRGTTPVGQFPTGASPYGILDMAGNVEEWTSDFYQPYEGGPVIVDDAGGPGGARVTRGGSYLAMGDLARCARRHALFEGGKVGARLVLVRD